MTVQFTGLLGYLAEIIKNLENTFLQNQKIRIFLSLFLTLKIKYLVQKKIESNNSF